ncbi:MAG: methionyl-tRNA formyltransferase [Pseudomonadota bacterium]
MRIIFMGTPEFAVPTLASLAGYGHEIAAVYTQPPRPAGRRGLAVVKSPVHRQSDILGFDVRTPESLKHSTEQEAFAALGADVAVVVAYGQLLPDAVLKAPRFGCYNGHASLLPRWRGAAPIQRAIMEGDTETGIMVMKMDTGLDTGPIAMEERVAIGPDMTAGELHDRLMLIGADLMQCAMAALERDSLTLTPQPEEGVAYAAKITKEETRIDFARDSAAVHNHIRGLSPYPGAWCEMPLGGKSERVKILRSARGDEEGRAGSVLDAQLTIGCASGSVRLLRLQKAGGKAMEAGEFLRGNRLDVGTGLA